MVVDPDPDLIALVDASRHEEHRRCVCGHVYEDHQWFEVVPRGGMRMECEAPDPRCPCRDYEPRYSIARIEDVLRWARHG